MTAFHRAETFVSRLSDPNNDQDAQWSPKLLNGPVLPLNYQKFWKGTLGRSSETEVKPLTWSLNGGTSIVQCTLHWSAKGGTSTRRYRVRFKTEGISCMDNIGWSLYIHSTTFNWLFYKCTWFTVTMVMSEHPVDHHLNCQGKQYASFEPSIATWPVLWSHNGDTNVTEPE